MKKYYFCLIVLYSILLKAQNYDGSPVTKGISSGARSNLHDITNYNLTTYDAIFPGAPTGNSEEVGVTKGELSVSQAGAAVYNLPIAGPPGLNGVVPEISINYSSFGGIGRAGYGWDIGGLSTISRIQPLNYYDQITDAVDLNFDKFVFNGQRLLSDNPLSYGTDNAVYKTENYSNLKITSYGISPYGYAYGPEYFKVEYPDGAVGYYGKTDNSRSSTEWALTYWENPQGVRISYTYFENFGILYAHTINYGSRLNDQPINKIEFTYVDRQRSELTYTGNNAYINTKILKEIKTYTNNIGYSQYILGHDVTSLGYERLTSVTEKSGDGTKSLNPTVFSYDNTNELLSYSSSSISINVGDVNMLNHTTVSGDFDSDGKMDFILYPTAQNQKTKYYLFNSGNTLDWTHEIGAFEEIMPVSFLTGDASNGFKLMPKQGWVVLKKDGNDIKFRIYNALPPTVELSPGMAFQYEKVFANNYLGGSGEKFYYYGDFNGDGLTDILAVNKADGKAFWVNLDKRRTDLTAYYSGYMTGITNNGKVIIADFNGDGIVDIMHFENQKLRVYKLNGNSLQLIHENTDADIKVDMPILSGDFNGDGKTDFIIPRGTGNDYKRYLSKGNSLAISVQIYDIPYNSSGTLETYQIIANDMNNDGKTDLIAVKSYRNNISPTQPHYNEGFISVRVFHNTANGFTDAGMFVTTGYSPSIFKEAIPIFLNANTPNKNLEMSFISKNSIFHFQSGKDFGKERLLRSVIAGNGVRETITYSSLTKCTTPGCSQVYTPNSLTENYPNYDIVDATGFQVVTKLEKQSFMVNQKQLYAYLGGVTNIETRGFTGFKQTLKTNWFSDDSQAISNISKFSITKNGAMTESYMVYGVPELSALFSPLGYISRAVVTYQDELSAAKVYKLWRTSLKEYDGISGISKQSSYTYDEYNNVTSTSYTQLAGSTVEQTGFVNAEYYNSPSGTAYYIGRVKKQNTSVTHNGDTRTTEEQYTYNNSQLLSQLKKKGHNTDYVTEENVYDVFGNMTSKTITVSNLPSRTGHYQYSSDGRFLLKTIDIEGLVTEFTYDPVRAQITTEKTPLGLTKKYEYDIWGKKIKETDYLGKNKVYSYANLLDFFVNSTSITETGDDGSIVKRTFDDLGREVGYSELNLNGEMAMVSTSYDIYNKKVSVSQPFSPSETNILYTTTTYDALGRVTKVVEPTGKITNTSYSQLTTTADDGVRTVTTLKNSLGYIKSSTDNGGTINYQYYADGHLKQSSFGTNVTTIVQDGWGRKTKITDPSGVYQQEYDGFGQVTKEITPKGVINYTYTPGGKIASKTVTGTNTVSTITYTYDNATKLLSQIYYNYGTPEFIEYHYYYDAYNRLIKTIDWGEYIYERQTTYDEFGRPLKELYKASPFGNSVVSEKWVKNTYKYGKLYQIIDDASNTVLWQANAVNAKGKLTDITLGNGYKLTNTYDQYGYISTIRYASNAFQIPGPEAVLLGYNFDVQKGLLNSKSNSLFNWSESFTYDNLERLIKWPKYSPLFIEKFTSGLGNFTALANATFLNNAGKLLVTATAANQGVVRKVMAGVKSGEVVKFKADVRRGTTNKVKIIVYEENPNTSVRTRFDKGFAPGFVVVGSTGIEFEHTVSTSGNIYVGFVKSDDSSDVGTSTTFTVDNVTASLGYVVEQSYDNTGRITENEMGSYVYGQSTKPYQQTALNYSDKGFDYYTNKMPDLYMDDMESKAGWNTSVTLFDSTSPAHSGITSLKIAKPNAAYAYLYAASEVEINNSEPTTYTYSVFVKGTVAGQLSLLGKNAEGESFTVLESKSIVAGNDWVKLEGSFLVAPEIKWIKIRLGNIHPAGGTVWFDDSKIIKGVPVIVDPQNARNMFISYNALNDPFEIEETGRDRISFSYNIKNQRASMYYGSLATDKTLRPLRKNYSLDGTMEVKYNVVTGLTEFVTYIGGDAYSAPIVYKSSVEAQTYLYLHRDYQGSIVAISNSAGNLIEKRLFDAWGEIQKVTDGVGNELDGLVALDRGYTGHEHLQSVGLIHMNGRLYDAKLHRFLQVDNNLQDPFNTQNFNRYGYVMNNPTKFTDPTGEFAFIPILIAAAYGAAVGAAVAVATYTVTSLASGNFSWSGLGTSALMGAVGGAISGGLSSVGAQLFNASSAFVQNGTLNIMTEFASQVGVSAAFGQTINAGTLAGSFIGAYAGYKMGNWSGTGGSWLKNAAAEIGFNTLKGAAKGAIAGFTASAINGTDFVKGTFYGARNGSVGGAVQSSLMIGIFGATYIPSDEKLEFVKMMSDATGVSYKDVAYRKGGLYQVVQTAFKYEREVVWGRNIATFDSTDAETFAHEFAHIIQGFKLYGWGAFQGRAIWEQLTIINPYEVPGTIEFEADRIKDQFYK